MRPTTEPAGRALTDADKQILHHARELKAPRIAADYARIADTARAQQWSLEEYLAAVLGTEAAARAASGAALRIKAAGFEAIKTLTDFDFTAQPSLDRGVIARLEAGAYLVQAGNVVLLGPPGTGKTHVATGLGIAAARTGHRVAFNSATGWITRLHTAHATGRLEAELAKIARIPLVIIDELGYVPIEAEAANLFFQLVSTRYEKASLIITSNLPFSRWGEVFGDTTIAAAMIDRIVHHAEIITTKGTSYRIRHTSIETLPSVTETGPTN
ncbi:AAA family ATPase [Kocuria rosea]|jgi:DNA replication protein DnaC|uniref:IS21-like element helper ATPase IstB n=1 Tax=Kocuria rosea TaxID=1275 RepID=UPI000D655456|nr:IS21-like element helper ATPase IstB [Kocuria rosea]PWF82694.1 AAA family ATPase [Kocuria rosea]QCY32990.1 AAA family ATPase [Kocuria rosea]TQN33615.1 DNA replication protein DnaC [Kocuria rosea]WIG15822.1 IS21-like element helper ATPase IstB [Kocuria rosea]